MRYRLFAALVPGTMALAMPVMAAMVQPPTVTAPTALRLVDDQTTTTDRARQLETDKNRARTLEKGQNNTTETQRARELEKTKDRSRTLEATDGKSTTEAERARQLEATRNRARTLGTDKTPDTGASTNKAP